MLSKDEILARIAAENLHFDGKQLVDELGNIYNVCWLVWFDLAGGVVNGCFMTEGHTEVGIYFDREEAYEARVRKMQEHPDRYYRILQASEPAYGLAIGGFGDTFMWGEIK